MCLRDGALISVGDDARAALRCCSTAPGADIELLGDAGSSVCEQAAAALDQAGVWQRLMRCVRT